eukprot:Platyproteum_vivax@DN4364_c0_g1_i1.p1
MMAPSPSPQEIISKIENTYFSFRRKFIALREDLLYQREQNRVLRKQARKNSGFEDYSCPELLAVQNLAQELKKLEREELELRENISKIQKENDALRSSLKPKKYRWSPAKIVSVDDWLSDVIFTDNTGKESDENSNQTVDTASNSSFDVNRGGRKLRDTADVVANGSNVSLSAWPRKNSCKISTNSCANPSQDVQRKAPVAIF